MSLIEVRCPHERNIPVKGRIRDYFPLTKAEVHRLLVLASVSEFPLTNTIQIRLGQAVKGVTCPRPTVGRVAERLAWLEGLYVETLRSEPSALPALTDVFCKLMEG